MRKRIVTVPRLGLITAAILASSNALAQNWETAAELRVVANQTSNPRLDVTQAESDLDTDTLVTQESVWLQAKRSSRATDLTMRAQADFVQFSQSDFLEDEENQKALIFGVYRPTENTTYSILGHYAHENYSRRNAVDSAGEDIGDEPAPEIDPSLALNQEQFRIDRVILQPKALWQLSRRSAAQISVDHRDNDFSDDANLADYGTTTSRAEWIYSLSEARLDYLKFNVGYSDYRSDGLIITENGQSSLVNAFDGSGIPFNVSYQRTFKSGLYAVFSAGITKIDIEEQGIDGETETIFGVYVGNSDSEDVRHKYYVSYNDYVNPNSSGILLKSQILRLGYEYKLSRSSRVGVQSLIFQNEQQSGAFVGAEQEYYNIEPYYNFDIGRSMSFSLRYRYRELTRETAGQDSDDHSFSIQFTYKLWG